MVIGGRGGWGRLLWYVGDEWGDGGGFVYGGLIRGYWLGETG